MKTQNYNPSVFEVNLTSAIMACKEEIQKNLTDLKIVETTEDLNRDNPLIIFQLEDKDGDQHEVVLKVIQRPDQL